MTNRIKLLIVDSEVRFLNTLTQRLSPRDFDVTPVNCGQEAQELTRRQEFDLVLLDPGTPGIGGGDLLAVLEKQHTEAVILTSQGSTKAASGCSGGRHVYLQKPAETADLLRVLREAYQKCVQRRLGLSDEKLRQLTHISLSETPLSILRKLKELDTSG